MERPDGPDLVGGPHPANAPGAVVEGSAAAWRVRALRGLLRTVSGLPGGARRALSGRPRTNDRGDVLDPDLQLLLRFENLQPQELSRRTPARARADMRASVAVVEGTPRAMRRIERHALHTSGGAAQVQVYVPFADDARTPRPVLVYLHGGGWVIGDIRTHDTLCRRLAVDGGQIVVSVDYPLAPEAPYPAGLRAVVDAFRWTRAHAASFGGDPGRIAIGGDSAGGNLAAATCLALRDAGEPQPAFQLLVYPACDLRCLTGSFQVLGEGLILTKGSIGWYIRHYGADPTDPRASVLLEPELRGLCPAIVVTAGFDPLRDEGEQYADRLKAAGVEVVALPFPRLVHGFANMDTLPGADRAVTEITEAITALWRSARRS